VQNSESSEPDAYRPDQYTLNSSGRYGPNARLRLLDDVGHFTPTEAPTEVADELNSLLQRAFAPWHPPCLSWSRLTRRFRRYTMREQTAL